VIALALVAAVVAYFRFVHKGTEPAPPATVAGTPSGQTQFDPNSVKTARSQRLRVSRPALTEPLRRDIRDIFTPAQLPPKPKPVVQPPTPVLSKPVEKTAVVALPAPPLNVELKGTVVGGNEPLAIINDKFVRLGEKVGDYQVVGITPSAVYLESGKHRKVLQVISGAAK